MKPSVEEIYEQVKSLQAKISWHKGKISTVKAKVKQYEYRKFKAVSYTKEIWEEKIEMALRELDLAKQGLIICLNQLKDYLNENL